MRLSPKDYISILKFYDIDISKMKAKEIKQQAEAILAEKLCRCIKSVDKRNKKVNKTDNTASENKAIAVCKNSVLTKKHLKIAKFTCNKTPRLLSRMHHKSTLSKTKRKLRLRKRVTIGVENIA
jgi:hypothetical protein